MGEKEYIELDEHYAVLQLPTNAIEIDINAKVYIDGKVQEVGCKYNLEEIRRAFQDADDNYIDPDERYVATELGKQFCEEMIKGKIDSGE